MTNWIFLNLFFSILRSCFLLHLCACALASSMLLFFRLGTLGIIPLFFSSFLYSLLEMTTSVGFLLGWLIGMTCLVYPPTWYRLETRVLFFFIFYHFLILCLLLLSISPFLLLSVVPYGHLCLLLSLFSPVLQG